MTDARRAELVAMAKAAQAETYDGTPVSLPSYELLALLRDLAAAEARLAERDELRHAALAKADEAMNAKCAERKRCEQAEARVGMLHQLVAAARTYIDPEQYAAWDAAAYAEVEPCDTLADQLAQAERERDEARAELDEVNEFRSDQLKSLRNLIGEADEDDEVLMGSAIAMLITRKQLGDNYRKAKAENASLRARVAAAERLARGARELHTCVASGLHPILPGLQLTRALDAVRDALAAWDATVLESVPPESQTPTAPPRTR